MTKEELEKYAYENRKRLDAQEVKIGDVVKVLRGQFAGETGVVVGIIACIGDYTDPYYEVDMECEVPDKYKCRKNTLAQPNNVIGGLSVYEFEVIGNRIPTQPTATTIKVGDMVIVKPDTPNKCKSVNIFKRINSVVTKIESGKATLDIDRLGNDGLELVDVPLEYIQKVDAIEHLHNHGWGDLGEFTPMPVSANPIIGFEQSYWQSYEADLAKEIVLKVANKYNGPKEAADYAVSVAKAVVENLKKK